MYRNSLGIAWIRQVGMSGKDVGGMTLSWSTMTQLNLKKDVVVYIILHINGTKKVCPERTADD